MSHFPPRLTSEQLAALPPEFQAFLRAVIDHYEQRIAGLEAEIASLKTYIDLILRDNGQQAPNIRTLNQVSDDTELGEEAARLTNVSRPTVVRHLRIIRERWKAWLEREEAA